MLDKRNLSNKHNNPNNSRLPNDLNKRFLENYNDETFFDLIGFGKIIYHPEKIIDTINETKAFPLLATLSLTNFCNHGCLWCSTAYWRESDAKKIDEVKLLNWLERAKKKGLRAVGYVGNGEPLAFKNFRNLTNKISSFGLQQGIFTNGYLIDRYQEELLNNFTYLRISLDAGSKEVHSRLHAVPENHFDKIMLNLKNFSKARKNKKPTIGVQFVLSQENIHDVENSIIKSIDNGADYFNLKPMLNRGTVNDKIKKNTLTYNDFKKVYEKIQKYKSNNFKVFFKPQQIIAEENDQNMLKYDKCFAGYYGVNIYEDGLVIACGPHHIPVGNLDTDLNEIEKNIIALTKKLDLVKCPAGCRYHPMNFLLHKIKNKEEFSEIDHVNFL